MLIHRLSKQWGQKDSPLPKGEGRLPGSRGRSVDRDPLPNGEGCLSEFLGRSVDWNS
jgi:hypothetical protein